MNPYESYAIFSEQTGKNLQPELNTEEMKPGLPNRVFNKQETLHGKAISIADPGTCERIRLMNGFYRVNGMSFLTMLRSGKPPVPPVPLYNLTDIYPGYCILYRSDEPPTLENMTGVLCLGTMGTAYDSGPSLFDCVLEVKEKKGSLDISLGHQCSYENHTPEDAKAYLRVGGSDAHICARIAIFRIG